MEAKDEILFIGDKEALASVVDRTQKELEEFVKKGMPGGLFCPRMPLFVSQVFKKEV